MTRSEPEPEGLLLVDKPEGPTSHDVVRWVRKALRTRRVGHAGTLDPFATGLLVAGVGRATRLLRFFSESEKTYEGVIRLGIATDSADRTGTPLGPERPCGDAASRAAQVVAERLTGELAQVPPMHSAKKIDGVALHELARRGESVERKPVPVRVHGWRLEPIDACRIRFEVTCSAGTYVRVLASDLGEMLGCGAHLESLRRTRSGSLRVEDAVPGAELAQRAPSALIPVDAIPLPLPSLRSADAAAERAFLHGGASDLAAWTGFATEAARGAAGHEGSGTDGGAAACRDEEGRLLGIAAVACGLVKPDVVLRDP